MRYMPVEILIVTCFVDCFILPIVSRTSKQFVQRTCYPELALVIFFDAAFLSSNQSQCDHWIGLDALIVGRTSLQPNGLSENFYLAGTSPDCPCFASYALTLRPVGFFAEVITGVASVRARPVSVTRLFINFATAFSIALLFLAITLSATGLNGTRSLVDGVSEIRYVTSVYKEVSLALLYDDFFPDGGFVSHSGPVNFG